MKKETAIYWIALAHLPRWGYLKINNLVIKIFHEKKISIEEFFRLSESDWKSQYQLDEKQVSDLKQAKSDLASNAFLAESFYNQGFEIIPITSPEYSKTLKANLKSAHAPAVLYVKGNKKILEEKSIAIVGSRDASETALKFTDNIAKLASKEFKVVVSGFAKGVDKQALDSAINVRNPEQNEKNANNLLIQKGAIPVDFNGVEIPVSYDTITTEQISIVQEPPDNELLEARIQTALSERPLTAKELVKKLNLTWTTKKLNTYLKKLDYVEVIKEKRTNLYKLKGTIETAQPNLFE